MLRYGVGLAAGLGYNAYKYRKSIGRVTAGLSTLSLLKKMAPISRKRKRYTVNQYKAGLGMMRKYKSYKKRRLGNTVTSGVGVTSQYDKKVSYYKKSAPRWKKRAYGRFARKVRSVFLKDVGTKTIIRNAQLTRTWATGDQDYVAVSIYGTDGLATTTQMAGHDDLKQIFDNDTTTKPTSKFLFGSAVCDITFTNLSTITDGTNQNTGMEIDIYEMVYGRQPDCTNPVALFNDAATNTDAINGLNPQINLTVRGATPFDLPDALSRGKVKILKKTKYFLAAGQCATYQFRDPKNRSFKKDVVDTSDNNYVLPWVTRTLFFVAKGIPTGDATKVLKALQVGCTRKYMYKVIEDNDDADNVL